MKLSLIIVNYHNSAVLKDCLESINDTVADVAFETIVVNNSRGDSGLRSVQQAHPEIRFLDNPRNVGFACANNQAARLARGDTLLFLNPDIVLTAGAVGEMLKALDTSPSIGVLGPKVLDPDGTLQYSCRRFPTFWTGLFNRYSLLTRLFPSNPFTTAYLMLDFDHQSAREVDWVSGCCMMIPRPVFDRIGMFDENYFLFNEDVDLCRAAAHLGYKVIYFPGAKVYHHITSSNRGLNAGIIIKRHLGMSYYYKKNHGGSFFLRGILNALIAVRCLIELITNPFK